MTKTWINEFPELQGLPSEDQSFLATRCQQLTLPAGKTVFAPGMDAQNFILLKSGIVKVLQLSNSGREIVLYRVEGGETCILTTSCLLSKDSYNAEAVTETDVEAILLPQAAFNELIATSEGFRNFVFSSYADRISSLIHLVEEVTFERIDKRLAQKLVHMMDRSNPISATHHDLAVELGTAREVISRHLKEFERRGWLRAGRGQIDILSPATLRNFSADH
ncbi:MAG: Crp/Fnr family transcriptional regulator [Sneathiella sp.]|nr:Crp/Fnr family transcriptional regulator [Sneathiella sp.]